MDTKTSLHPITGQLMPRSNGRPKGSKNKATLLREKANLAMLETATAEGISPLEVMLRLMREAWSEAERLQALAQRRPLTQDEDKALRQARLQARNAAVRAAPYMHGKMAPVHSKATQTVVVKPPKF